ISVITTGGITPADPIQKIMTTWLAEVSAEESLRLVAEELASDEIGTVLVGAPGIFGLISERDLVTTVANGGDLDALRASDIMTTDLVAARPQDSIASVGQLMIDAGVRHIVIREGDTGTGDAVVGLVSIRDVLTILLASVDPDRS